jgi:hypothetical protein
MEWDGTGQAGLGVGGEWRLWVWVGITVATRRAERLLPVRVVDGVALVVDVVLAKADLDAELGEGEQARHGAAGLEVGEGAVHGGDGGAEQRDGVDGELESELLELGGGEDGRLAALDHVGHLGRVGRGVAEGPHLVDGLGRFHENCGGGR